MPRSPNERRASPSAIAVIGRGIAGLSAAFRLSQRGWAVTVIGPSEDPEAASPAAVGISAIKGLLFGSSPLFRAKIAGHRHLPGWIRELEAASGRVIPKRFDGVIEPFWDLKEYARIRDRVYHRVFTGSYRMRRLGRSDLCQEVFHSFPQPLGAFSYPADGAFDVEAALAALDQIVRSRASILEGRVDGIRWDSAKGAWELRLASGDQLAFPELLLAAGAAVPRLLEASFSIDLKGIPVGGRTLVAKDPGHPDVIIALGSKSYVRLSGRLRMGSTSHKGSLGEREADLVQLREEMAKVSPLPPSVRDVAGLRLRFSDRLPAVGPLPIPGVPKPLWLLAGLYKNGMQLADLSAFSLCKQLAGEAPLPPFEAFLPARLVGRV